ncbi:MAG: sigma-54 dependent transcriptional regulator [Candidatus Brocadiia bacterium]
MTNQAEETKGRILVVDDEESICTVLEVVLRNEGYEVTTTTDGYEGLKLFKESYPDRPYDLIIQDIKMPEISGLTLLGKFQEINPEVIVLIITAFSSYQVAVEAMRLGAYDYIQKPFDNELDLKPTIQRAVHMKRLMTMAKTAYKDEEVGVNPFKIIVGTSPEMKKIYDLIRRVAQTDSTVIIQGESGTGKELVARALHYQSARMSELFLTVNCGAFTETLLESELFGHIKGSFTHAISDKKGLLEVADKGTFFLDEVSELSPALQVKLLRVIEAREFKPVGSVETKKSDVRFITATNVNLEDQVKKGLFREDLFYRLNVINIHLPPLRERSSDIPLLAGHFLGKYARMMKKDIKGFDTEALETLMLYHWPGNIRELENSVQRAVALSQGALIKPDDLNLKLQPLGLNKEMGEPVLMGADGGGVNINMEEKMTEIEKAYIEKALKLTNGNLTEAAKLLGTTYRTLRYKAKKYNITP